LGVGAKRPIPVVRKSGLKLFSPSNNNNWHHVFTADKLRRIDSRKFGIANVRSTKHEMFPAVQAEISQRDALFLPPKVNSRAVRAVCKLDEE
jgi:hypothetical protein